MRALLIACSIAAYERMQRLKKTWEAQEPEDELICLVKCASLPELSEKESLSDCVGRWFSRVDAIVFWCASGIAVRSIAPWLVHKSQDPAVIVMDETEKFCIPILSGHWGGANALAQRLASMTGAALVITTATDREEKFAVDEFARRNGLLLKDWKLAKKISAQILEGKSVGFYSEQPVEGTMPPQLHRCAGQGAGPGDRLGIAVSNRRAAQGIFPETLQLIPGTVVAGVGCRRGSAREKIEGALRQCLAEEGICQEALCAVASIDLKQEEAGILACCETWKIPFFTFPAEVLRRVEGNFSGSAFVEAVTGVENVCERSALAAADMPVCGGEGGAAAACRTEMPDGGGVLLCKKRIYDGVTVALAERKGSVRF